MASARVLVPCVFILALSAGCAHRAAKPVPPLAINVEAAGPTASATLHSIIVRDGPGQWSKYTAWDEYVVTIRNLGADELTIESVTLVDCTGTPILAENGPNNTRLVLQDRSRQNLKRYREGRLPVRVDDFPPPAAAEMLGPMPILHPAMLAVGPVTVATIDHRAHLEIVRRRLLLPMRMAGRTAETGSWFFPMSAGPARIVIQGRSAGALVTLEIALPSSVANIHLDDGN